MKLRVNEFLGKAPDKKDDSVNIYAFYIKNEKLLGDNEEVVIETLNTNYSVFVVEEKMLNNKVLSLGLSDEQKADLSYIHSLKRAYSPKDRVHLVFSQSSKRLMMTSENVQDDHSYLIDIVKDALKEVLSGEIDLESKVKYWQHRHYVVAPLWAFKGLSRFIDMESLGDYVKLWVFLYDSRDENLVNEIEKQIGPENGPFRKSKNESTVFMTGNSISINNERIDGPIILLDKNGKSEFDIERALYNFFVLQMDIPESEYVATQLKQHYYIGYDVRDLFYFNYGNEGNIELMASTYDRTTTPDKRDSFMEKLDGMGVDLTDAEVIKFAKMLSMYLRVFPAKDQKYHYKTFYSIASIGFDGDQPPPSPIDKNEGLFESFFSLAEGPGVSGQRAYYLIASRFCFPASVFSLFISNPSLDLHEILEFNWKNGMLSKFSFLENEPKDPVKKLDYQSKAVVPFVKSIQESLGDKVTENRFNERLSVKRLSEFPYAFDRIQAAFNREGIPFKDINVLLVYNETETGILGGYDCKRLRNEDNVSLLDGYAKFQLPIMLFNLANPKIQSREGLSGTIIHEAKHYLDDMRIEKGKERADFFSMNYRKEKDPALRYKKYLSSKAETSAFAEDAMNVLRHYDLSYIRYNWFYIKDSIINQYFKEQKGFDYYTAPQDLMDEYSEIMELALRLYEKEEEKKAEDNSENSKV